MSLSGYFILLSTKISFVSYEGFDFQYKPMAINKPMEIVLNVL